MRIVDQRFEFGNANFEPLHAFILSLRRFALENICDINDIELRHAFYPSARRVVIDVYCFEVDEATAKHVEDIALIEEKVSEYIATVIDAAYSTSLTINYPLRHLVIDHWSWLKWDRVQFHFSEFHTNHMGHNCHWLGCGRVR